MTTTNPKLVIDADAMALNGIDAMTVENIEIAGTPALVVDNVYKDPDYVRGLALSLNYARRAGAYPGYFAFVTISASPLLDLLNTLMRDALGDYLAFTPTYQDDLVFAVTTERGEDLSPGQRRPHTDGFCDYAALVYLNPPERCSGGTSFWRHRASGIELVRTPEHAVAVRSTEDSDSDSLPAGYLTESNDTWERTQVLPMQYNRLSFYDSRLCHTPHYVESDFGTALPDRRLTQNLYLDRWQTRMAKTLAAGRRAQGS